MSLDPYKIIRNLLGRPEMPIEEAAGFYNNLAQIFGDSAKEDPRYDLALSRFHSSLGRFDVWLVRSQKKVSPSNLPLFFRMFLDDGGCPAGSPRKIEQESALNRFDELRVFLQGKGVALYDQAGKIREDLMAGKFTFEEEQALSRVAMMIQRDNAYHSTVGSNLLRSVSWRGTEPSVPQGLVEFVRDLGTYLGEIAARINNTPMKTNYFRLAAGGILNTLENPQGHRDSRLWQLEFAERMRHKMNEDIGGSLPDIVPYMFLLLHEGQTALALKLYSVLSKIKGLRPRMNVISLIYLCALGNLTDARISLTDAALDLALEEGERIEQGALNMDAVDLTMVLRSDPQIQQFINVRARNDKLNPMYHSAPGVIKEAFERIYYDSRSTADQYFAHNLFEGIVALMRHPSIDEYIDGLLGKLVEGYLEAKLRGQKDAQRFLDTTVPILDDLLEINAYMQAEQFSPTKKRELLAASDVKRDIEIAVEILLRKKEGTPPGGAPNNPPVDSGGSMSPGGSGPMLSAPADVAVSAHGFSGFTYVNSLPAGAMNYTVMNNPLNSSTVFMTSAAVMNSGVLSPAVLL